MPVSGVVITLSNDEALSALAQQQIGADSRFTLGDTFGPKLAAVCETKSVSEDETAWEWLHALKGVVYVDLVSVDFSDVENFGKAAHVLGVRGRVNGRPRQQEQTSQEASQ